MPMPSKSCYRLDEIAERWLVTEADLLTYALDGRIELSVLLVGQEVVFGRVENGKEVVTERRPVLGPLAVYVQDVGTVLKIPRVEIRRFKSHNPDEYIRPAPPRGWLFIGLDDVVLTLEERDRFERQFGLQPDTKTISSDVNFVHNADYSVVNLDGCVFDLGEKQAAMVRKLHEASLSGKPWVHGSALLTAAQSESAYPGELFKSKKNWELLIERNRRGGYRLRLPTARQAGRRAFRSGSSALLSTIHSNRLH